MGCRSQWWREHDQLAIRCWAVGVVGLCCGWGDNEMGDVAGVRCGYGVVLRKMSGVYSGGEVW